MSERTRPGVSVLERIRQSDPERYERLVAARLRARARSIAQDMGRDPEEAIAKGAGYILRPHEVERYDLMMACERGRKLAKRYGW